jgi:hypothetical protein
MNKKIIKRDKLIKKLVRHYLNDSELNSDLIKCRIKKLHSGVAGRMIYYFDNHKNITKASIILNPYIIRNDRIIYGYPKNSYYLNRDIKINPLIINNYKQALRFIILHEIGHLKFYCKYGIGKKYKKELLEKYADCYAKRYLNKNV